MNEDRPRSSSQRPSSRRSAAPCSVSQQQQQLYGGGGDDDIDEIPGDGPINGITACANACLPTLLRQSVKVLHRDTSGGSTASNGSITSSHHKESSPSASLQLFVAIAQGVQEICSSPLRIVRAFAAETLYTLHATLLEVVANDGPLPADFETEVVNHFFRVSFGTAKQASCSFAWLLALLTFCLDVLL